MTPRYRAWIKTEKRMFFSDDILAIDYENEEIVTQQVYFENGLPDDRDIYCYDFDEIELMQSTGLKDKNGKEIFEGDIVRTTRFLGRADEIGGFYEYDKEFIGIVKQLEGSWVIDTGSDAVCLWTEIEENEIIGNIYENKEFGGRK
ncbi:YopX protein [Streptococcus pneumoniae]|uniref:YopX protein n=2 Tax=Streptococcus pneumoniae TaxID=1313 RepID=A0A4J1ZQ16_STREE|nr:YopX family protein [Streptococcus pneumoniae]EHE64336.1 yopX family protein [Streptococcus pneumoniae EU-NP01]MCZ4955314.1 YopX family protein [Streptococcus pneumoniae]MDS3772323.1 YopX family protein [Streptococcus pneumoniae]MDS4379103.1 YopX family protein [Streptococcus pneumoniae]MDS4495417.1 YopX family protein [Streptococcus pneumoniae]